MKNFRKVPIPTWVLLILVNGSVLCAGFFLFLMTSLNALKSAAIEQTEINLRSFAYSIDNLLPSPPADPDAFVKNLGHSNPLYRITLIRPDGTIIADSSANISTMQNHSDRKEVQQALSGREGKSMHISSTDGRKMMYLAIPAGYNHEKIVLRLSMPVEETVIFSKRTKNSLTLTMALIFFAVLLSSLIISFKIINPINMLQKASDQYKNGNFDYHVMIQSPKEMAALGKSFTSMADTISQNIESMKKLENVRKDFVANVSHEFKTPVTSIKGFSETLLDGAIDDTENARHFLNIINTQCDRLMGIIEDLLTLSRLENDNTAPDTTNTDIVELLRNLCDNMSKTAAKNKTKIEFNSERMVLFAKINPGLISQAVSNLIENSIKYCPEHSIISLDVEEIQSDSGKKSVRIIEQDNGPGIPPQYRERIFERFYRVDKGRSRETGGTGLGLSIVRHIVSLHAGSVVETGRTDGKTGVRFVMDIPLTT